MGANSRKLVLVILDEINRSMAPYKNRRAWLHEPLGFVWLIPAWLLVLMYAILGPQNGWPLASKMSVVAGIGAWIWFPALFLTHRIIPYTQFRSDEGKRGVVLRTLILSVLASLLAAYVYQALNGGQQP